MSFKAHEKGTCRRAFHFQAQSSAQMKGGNGNIEAYCGFIPLMSSATRNPL